MKVDETKLKSFLDLVSVSKTDVKIPNESEDETRVCIDESEDETSVCVEESEDEHPESVSAAAITTAENKVKRFFNVIS